MLLPIFRLILYKSTDNINFTVVSSSNTQVKTVTGLSVNTTYYFKVLATTTTGGISSLSSSVQQATLNIVPNAPTGLLASSITSTGLTLSWTAPVGNGGSAVTSYNIYKSTDNTTFTVDSSSNTTSKAITGLSVNTTYYFKVTAVNSQGEGAQSSGLQQATLNIVPGVPTSLIASDISSTSLTLSWTAPVGNGGSVVTSYNIYKSTDNSTFTVDSSSNTTSKAITNLSVYTTYYFKVTAVNSQGEGSYSNNLMQKTLSTVPDPVTDLSGIAVSYSKIDLSWNAPLFTGGTGIDISGYNLHVSRIDGGPSFALIPYIDISNVQTTYYNLTDLSKNTQYGITVEAFNLNGKSSGSNVIVTTLNPVSAPTDLSMNDGILYWTGPVEADSYKISLFNGSTFDEIETGYLNEDYDTKLLSLSLGLNKIRVISVNGQNTSIDISGEYQFTTSKPDAPTNVQVIENTLSWDYSPDPISSNVTNYKISYWDNSLSSYVLAYTLGITNNQDLSNTWVPAGTTKFRVQAVNTYGDSSESDGVVILSTPWGVPAIPVFVATIPNNEQIIVQWNNVESIYLPVTYTLILYDVDNNQINYVENINSNSYNYTGLTNGVTYKFKVKGVNPSGESSLSSFTSDIPYTTAEQISEVLITPGNTLIDLSWNAPFDGGRSIDNYIVEKSEIESEWITIGTPISTYYTATELTNGVTYNFRISANNLAGSNAPSMTVSEIPYTTADQISTVAILAGNTIIDLSWNVPFDGGRDISDYLIEKSLNNSDWIADGSSNTTYYTASGLINGQTYYFKVYARNIDGLSPASNTISEIPYTYSDPIINFNSVKYASSVELTWDVPLNNGGADISGYTLTYYPTEGSSTIISNITDTSYNVSGLEPNTEYTFEIVVQNRAGNSNIESITLTTYATTAPVNFSGDASDNSVYLSWEPPTDNGGLDISGYVISINTEGYSDISLNATSTNYNYTGLINGTTYQFTIYAYNEAGIGQTTLITRKTTEYTTTSELPPGQDYYVITIDGVDTQFENTLVVTDFSQNDIGISQDPTLFSKPTLFITSTFDISSIDNLVTTALTGYQKQISDILIKRDVSGEQIISQGKIRSVLEGNTIAYDLSENYTELKFDESDLSDNVLSVLSVIESTLSEIQNKRYMKFFVKLIDLSSEELITNGFNLPILFNLTKTNVSAETLILQRGLF